MDNAEINRIRQQFASGHWPKFLESIMLDGLKGWCGQTINFAFPVTAVVGENGSGKSTFLKAAACAYENENPRKIFYPSTFFLDTHWDQVTNCTLEFRVRQGNSTTTYRLRKPSKRWSIPETRPRRHVFLQDISRTLPLDASAGYAKIARLAAGEVATDTISGASAKSVLHLGP